MQQLIWARSVQGIGGALLIPGSLAIISATFPAERRGRAIGIWSGFTAMTSAIGPVLGGWLIEHASWHWLFFINVPLAAIYAALAGALFFLPFNLIQVQHYSPTAAGAALVPFPILMFLLSRWSGGLVDRYGARKPLVVGPTIAAVGLGLMSVPSIGGSYWTTFFPAVIVLGLGMAICVAPLTTTVMAAVEVRYAGAASGINNAVSRIAGLVAIAVLGIVVANIFNASLDRSIISLDLSVPARQFLDTQRINLAAAAVPPGLSTSASAALRSAIALAFVDGFRWVMWIAAGLAVTSAAIAALMLGETRQ